MNLTILRALLLDALYQVLDNKVFRILGALVGFAVLLSFVLSFDADGIDILFGLWRVDYAEETYDAVRMSSGVVSAVTESVSANYAKWLIDWPSLIIGMFFSVVATAFFLPHMLERGTADLAFSRPIPRWQLLLTTYASGLLFVGLLSTALSVGVYFGLAVASGVHVPDLLWSPLSNVYLFAMVFVASICAGLLTRSAVAAILLTIVFFGGTLAVHAGWYVKTSYDFLQAKLEADVAAGIVPAEGRQDELESDEDMGPFARYALRAVEVAHHVLPKTLEAFALRDLVREGVEQSGPYWEDAHTGLRVPFLPDGMHEDRAGASAELRRQLPNLETWSCVFGAVDPTSADAAISIWSIDRSESLKATARTPAGDYDDRHPVSSLLETVLRDGGNARALRHTAGELVQQNVRHLSWEATDERSRPRRFDVRVVGLPRFVLIVAIETSADARDPRPAWQAQWLGTLEVRDDNPMNWHAERFGWTSAWKFNAFYSLGSSLAFIAAVLGFCAWRLRRIDF